MSSRRLLKAAEAIREVVSMAILTELRDPRIRDVTVTHVEMAPDMRSARIHVSIMGNESRQNLTLRGLQNAAGFLQQKINDRIDTRYTPRLQFVLDKGVKNSIAVSRILNEVLGEKRGDQAGPVDVETAESAVTDHELDDPMLDDMDDDLDDVTDDHMADDQSADEEDSDPHQ